MHRRGGPKSSNKPIGVTKSVLAANAELRNQGNHSQLLNSTGKLDRSLSNSSSLNNPPDSNIIQPDPLFINPLYLPVHYPGY